MGEGSECPTSNFNFHVQVLIVQLVELQDEVSKFLYNLIVSFLVTWHYVEQGLNLLFKHYNMVLGRTVIKTQNKQNRIDNKIFATFLF